MKQTIYGKALDRLHSQKNESIVLLKRWVEVNSGSENLEGLAAMTSLLAESFLSVGATIERITLPPQKKINRLGEEISVPLGAALRFRKHPQASASILLAGHMDTVYAANHPFQKMSSVGIDRLIGPGVADMKGGLLVMLKALEVLESSRFAGALGWEVIINPDEEIGSPGSAYLFAEAATRHRLGLVYEPAFSDGSLVSLRKGSANITLIAKGRSAHAGRDFHHGRNALAALARSIGQIDALSVVDLGTTVNVAQFESHFPSNIVPDLASCRINVRAYTATSMEDVEKEIRRIAAEQSRDGITICVYADAGAPPKPFDLPQQQLYHAIKETGESLGIALPLKESGGTCDGARLYAHGLPNIDSMGVVGGGLHTVEEYCLTDSITERAALSALFLLRLASGELTLDLKETST